MSWIKEVFALIGLFFKAILQYNSPERREERRKKKLEEEIAILEMEVGYALRIKDSDRLAVANAKLVKLREQAGLFDG